MAAAAVAMCRLEHSGMRRQKQQKRLICCLKQNWNSVYYAHAPAQTALRSSRIGHLHLFVAHQRRNPHCVHPPAHSRCGHIVLCSGSRQIAHRVWRVPHSRSAVACRCGHSVPQHGFGPNLPPNGIRWRMHVDAHWHSMPAIDENNLQQLRCW